MVKTALDFEDILPNSFEVLFLLRVPFMNRSLRLKGGNYKKLFKILRALSGRVYDGNAFFFVFLGAEDFVISGV